MRKILITVMIALSLSGCAALQAIQALGGGTATKGHGNDNVVLVGSDMSNGVSTGGKTDVDAENVGGDVTGRDKKDVNVAKSGDIHITEGMSSWIWLIIAILIPSPVKALYKIIKKLVRRKKDDR